MHQQLIKDSLAYISRQWKSNELTLEKVASAAGFSLSYFDRLFTRSVGQSVMEYVRNYKLICSASMLRTSDRSILDISLDLGYANPENYTRAFHGLYGMPPSDYRERHRNISVTWRDRSTGVVIRLFESENPGLRRIDTSVVIDTLITQNPLFYFPECFMLTQTDSAVYTMDTGETCSFIAVYEYRPEEMILEIFCSPEHAQAYLAIAKRFPNALVGYVCEPDTDTAALSLNLPGFSQCEYSNFVYQQDEITVPLGGGFTVRLLDADDHEHIRRLSPFARIPLEDIFRQKFEFGNHAAIDMLGLFKEGKCVGCTLPSMECVRGVRMSDIGDIIVMEESLRSPLWAAAIKHALDRGARPTNIGVLPGKTETGAEASVRMGYTLLSKKLMFSNIPNRI